MEIVGYAMENKLDNWLLQYLYKTAPEKVLEPIKGINGTSSSNSSNWSWEYIWIWKESKDVLIHNGFWGGGVSWK